MGGLPIGMACVLTEEFWISHVLQAWNLTGIASCERFENVGGKVGLGLCLLTEAQVQHTLPKRRSSLLVFMQEYLLENLLKFYTTNVIDMYQF